MKIELRGYCLNPIFAMEQNTLEEPVLPAIANGSEEAVRACLDRYGGLVWSIARRLTFNTAEAEDAVQEAFLGIWKSAARFDNTKSTEKAFIAMIARRRIIDRVRASKRRVDAAPFDASNELTANYASVDLEMQEEADRARRMMAELRADERQVLELAIDHGLTQTEISQRTGMPLGTVKTNARRGMSRLRDMLGNDTTFERGTTR